MEIIFHELRKDTKTVRRYRLKCADKLKRAEVIKNLQGNDLGGDGSLCYSIGGRAGTLGVAGIIFGK